PDEEDADFRVDDIADRIIVLRPRPPDRKIRSPLEADVVPKGVPRWTGENVAVYDSKPSIVAQIQLWTHNLKDGIEQQAFLNEAAIGLDVQDDCERIVEHERILLASRCPPDPLS